ncbi:MAG: AMP-binding protein [Anderseniella sp.]
MFILALIALTFVAWRRYLWASAENQQEIDTCPYSLTEVFGDTHFVNVPHQKGAKWLNEIFSRSARRFPDLPALQIPVTGETLTFAELDKRAEIIAEALSQHLTGPDQVVAVAMPQNNWHIVASHLGVLRAGGAVLFLDTSLPEALISHMLDDAQPVAVVTRGLDRFENLPTIDVLKLPDTTTQRELPQWLDDPSQRLATIFYTSGTTGMPKGVESTHAGYVNLALTYADYFDLIPGVDATSLTSSLGYDGSISEMYSAWVSGCAVVMLTSDQLRSGPDLLPVLRDAEVTVLFCPPVLLTTLTPNPEIDLPYPLCRYIVPAGEAFPSVLVEPWTLGRRQIINTYGPTEASTDTSRQSLRPGEPITIGTPFPNVTYVILEVGELTPVHHGEVGELCIGGVHVARGYRNLPEQTAEKFFEHPQFGRLYRTGDRCKIDLETKRVHFLGRIDAQLKVRGHRVETQAVEDILQTQFNEIEAAVLDYQNESLVAFVLAPSIAEGPIKELAPASAEWAAHVTQVLARQLPAPSVPTRIFLVRQFTMKPVSGKIDRARLPQLSELSKSVPSAADETPGDLPDVSRKLAANVVTHGADDIRLAGPGAEEVLAICQEVCQTPLGWDDRFVDAGAHSIAIARLAQRLQSAGYSITVRDLMMDCNTARKVVKSAQRRKLLPVDTSLPAQCAEPTAGRDEAAAEVLSIGYFTTLQVLFAALIYAPALAGLFGILGHFQVEVYFMTTGLWGFIAASCILYVAALLVPFGSLGWVMAIKFVMGGDCFKNDLTPGTYPKWSRMHLRIWCIGRMEASVLVPLGVLFRSAPLLAFALRQLGAKVGTNLQCAHDAALSGPLDLITIGNDVSIQTGAYIGTVRWTGENLVVGPIRLNDSSKIGMRAAVAPDVTVGAGTWITPFTPILHDTGPNELWEGAPAHRTGHCTQLNRTTEACRYNLPLWLLETINILGQIIVSFWLTIVPVAIISWYARDLIPVSDPELASTYFRSTPFYEIAWHLILYTVITTWIVLVVTSVLSCAFLRCTAFSPGLYPSSGVKAALLLFRVKMMNAIQQRWTWSITGQYLRALAGMRFTRLGASECDAMFNLVPELATAAPKLFWSNGCFTNMLDYGSEHIKLHRLDMPWDFFTGNNCVVEHGRFPSNFLIGVSTPASQADFRCQMRTRPGSPVTVVGNPPVQFPRVQSDAVDGAETPPGFPLFMARVLIFDVLSIGLLPSAELLVFALLFGGSLHLDFHPVAGSALALIATEATMVLLSVVVKSSLVGKEWGRDHSTAFWSRKHFAYFFAQDCFFAWCRRPLNFLSGTILANVILRAMGCVIGQRTIVAQPLQTSDWNAVNFGNDCIVNGFLQFHTFENLTLQVKQARLSDRCAINFGATVMGGTVIEQNSTLLPLSLVLKEMVLPSAVYEGSPVEHLSTSLAKTTHGQQGRDLPGWSIHPSRLTDSRASGIVASDDS